MTRRLRMAILIAFDAFLVQLTVWTALYLRLEGQGMVAYWGAYLPWAPVLAAGTVLAGASAGLYVSLWRYASVTELLRISLVGIASAGLLAIASIVGRPEPLLPRSVPIIYGLLLVAALGVSRLSLRIWRRWRHGWRPNAVQPTPRPRVLIVGAGDAGAMVLDELTKNQRLVIGFVDDDPAKKGLKVRGVPVIGTPAQVPDLVRRLRVDEVLLAMPSAPARRLRELVESWKKLPAKLSTLPRVQDLIDGRVTVSQIRPVALEDLLSRPPVRLDTEAVAGLIRGRRVLVTGAGGSIGSELCRQIGRFGPAELVMLGNGENSLFEAEQTMQELGIDVPRELVVADVRDRGKMARVFSRYRPELVFHAAAHKHVPFMESQPDEACKTNVFGTQNVALSALEAGCERFVLISTDKAVNPSSVMGVTKRVAEMIVQDLNRLGRTRFMAVRFGNVLGSRGSVVPVFQRQIARGGPVTVTDPDMQRYFMTIPEATQLVLQAAVMGRGGEVFVLDMGEPVRIIDLARHLIRLSGYEPEKDIPIRFTGRRPGEKLYEELLTAEEGTDVTHHERVHIARGNPPDPELLAELLAELAEVTFRWDVGEGVGATSQAWREVAATQELAGTAGARLTGTVLKDGEAFAREEEILGILSQLVPSYRPDRESRGVNGVA